MMYVIKICVLQFELNYYNIYNASSVCVFNYLYILYTQHYSDYNSKVLLFNNAVNKQNNIATER